jgi:hypothetical protein
MFDDGSDLEYKIYHPTLWDRITYWIGVPSYRLGCFFYNLQDDTLWMVHVARKNAEAEDDDDDDEF